MIYRFSKFFSRKILTLLASSFILGLTGCLVSNKEEEPSVPVIVEKPKDSVIVKKPIEPIIEKAMIFAVTSDYKTGSYSVYGLDSAFTSKDIAPIHSDAAVRFAGGNDILVLNRLGRDNMQVVDRHNLQTVLQFNFPAASNPYDVVVKDSLFYVGFYAYSKIGVYRQKDGSKLEEIDISAFTDTVDFLPETAALKILGNNLYVILGNLDAKSFLYSPLQARLLQIDLLTKSTKSLDLPFGNPLSITYDSASNKFFIPCAGTLSNPDYTLKKDGAILGINLSSLTVSDTVATETTLGGGLNKTVYYKGKLYMDLTTEAEGMTLEKLISINLADKKAETMAEAKGYEMSGLVIDEKTNTLYLGDRRAGLRIFDLATGQEKEGSKINLGLPISDLAIVR